MTALPTVIRPKLAKLVPMLGSDFDHEVIGAARAISRTLRSAGSTLHDLAEEVAHVHAPAPRATCARDPADDWSPVTWSDLARWIGEHGSGRLAKHEREFVTDMGFRLSTGTQPTERQARWLQALRQRLAGGRHAR